jgi:hypothetical protein
MTFRHQEAKPRQLAQILRILLQEGEAMHIEGNAISGVWWCILHNGITWRLTCA